ncbi:acetoacetyl-CoA synthetase-like protein [Kickxella alabastrina]|uniref:acetoacetyl-CoA synthetase-like protein n=1 Tax=Kickxella alabastrina TaxID=61397 RepID=UPI00221FBE82|nr:acetoacetyl-CoA synthetase-like protein [Kickxella alabastrina]KAI7830941.1 acetoacetyl-CoA synthetase-like protein [Kickxella alabastrina]
MTHTSTSSAASQQPLWTPKNPAQTNTHTFRRFVNAKRGLSLETYDELHAWSVDDIESFWSDVWEYTGTVSSRPYSQVLEQGKTMDEIPKWFIGAKLNYTENVFAAVADSQRIAIHSVGEGRALKSLSFGQLRDQVRLCASAMRNMGLVAGDRVAGYVPNITEAVIAFLAAASIGAIWSSTSTDFGSTAVLDRFVQIEPKLLFSTDATGYNGKVHPHAEKLAAVAEQLPSVQRLIVIPFSDSDAGGDLSARLPNACTWADFMATGDSNARLEFEQLPFEHPLFILFSSGTTGKPKCLVHSAGGLLLQHRKEHQITQDLTPDDILLYYTTTGWMMWNWLVGALSVGTAIVLYEGSPFKPAASTLWSLVDSLKITAFGTSAKYIQTLEDIDYRPKRHHHLSTLKAIYSTASPLKPNSFDFVYEHIKADGEVQTRGLGMAVECWIGENQPALGQSGDMVCVKPFPCMPVFFWGDKDNQRYRSAYFDYYAHVWYHGDFMIIDEATGGVHMLGRSDGTLNPAGVRFGSAELYNIVDTYPEVADSLVVGQRQGVDERVLMFLQMVEGHAMSADVVKRISAHIRSQLSPRHVPALILQATGGIPYTVNGKKVEIAVKKLVSDLYRVAQESGADVALTTVTPDEKTTSTLANPESLLQYYSMPELLK